MALFTTADRDAIKSAMVTLATEGVATVSVGGQSVTARSLDELRRLLDMVQQDLANATATGTRGLRFSKTIPPGAG